MATTRRKSSSGFTTPKKEEEEINSVEEFLEESAQEVLTVVSQLEEKVEAQAPAVLPEIVPTEDVGPRFVEQPTVSEPEPQVVIAQKLQPPPKRHPRNIPKFSSYK